MKEWLNGILSADIDASATLENGGEDTEVIHNSTIHQRFKYEDLFK